jgi:hypothetical protein
MVTIGNRLPYRMQRGTMEVLARFYCLCCNKLDIGKQRAGTPWRQALQLPAPNRLMSQSPDQPRRDSNMVLRDSSRASQIVCLKPPGQAGFYRVVQPTAKGHGKSSFCDTAGQDRRGNRNNSARTARGHHSGQIYMFSANKELSERSDLSIGVRKLRPEEKVVNSGTLKCVYSSVRLNVAAGTREERLCRSGRRRRTAVIATGMGCEEEPAVQVDGDRGIPPIQAQPQAGTAGAGNGSIRTDEDAGSRR